LTTKFIVYNISINLRAEEEKVKQEQIPPGERHRGQVSTYDMKTCV
jgi:hypothetical protein